MSVNLDPRNGEAGPWASVRASFWRMAGPWWMYLLTGIAWLVISVVVLRFNLVSVAAVGILLGVLFLIAGLDEFMIASVRASWRWAHVLMGILFILGAIWSFLTPFGAFWALATVLGLLFILSGSFHIITSIYAKDISQAWWLGLIGGILEILIGFWASQQAFPAQATLLIIWVGLLALFRGIFEIVLAFELRGAQRA